MAASPNGESVNDATVDAKTDGGPGPAGLHADRADDRDGHRRQHDRLVALMLGPSLGRGDARGTLRVSPRMPVWPPTSEEALERPRVDSSGFSRLRGETPRQGNGINPASPNTCTSQ